jgi:hypothetical protein
MCSQGPYADLEPRFCRGGSSLAARLQPSNARSTVPRNGSPNAEAVEADEHYERDSDDGELVSIGPSPGLVFGLAFSL